MECVFEQTLEEQFEQDWILGVVLEEQAIEEEEGPTEINAIQGARRETQLIMVDSGFAQSVFKRNSFDADRTEIPGKGLTTVTGESIRLYGRQTPTLTLLSGRRATIEGIEADVNRNIMAVSSSADKGLTTVFGPRGSFLTRCSIEKPQDAEDLIRIGRHYFLEASEEDGEKGEMIAPEGEQGGDGWWRSRTIVLTNGERR